MMKYNFFIKFRGRDFNVYVKGSEVTIEGLGIIDENTYEVLRNYIEDEGFITEADQRKGIYELF